MQVEYQYYAEYYGGSSVSEPQWIRLELKAEARLNGYTFSRLMSPWPEEAKNAVCEMVEALAKYEKRDGKISENNDGYSVSYETQKPLDEHLYDITSCYLLPTGLLDLEVDESDNEC